MEREADKQRGKDPGARPRALGGHPINWNQVFYFYQIALHGSLKEAGQKLGVSSSTLSEHLSALERDLQMTLFRRDHRKLSLTEKGARLFACARDMFEAGQRLIDVVSPVSVGNYPISVGLVAGASVHVAYRTLERYLGASGPLTMNVVQMPHETLETELLRARLDFGFSDRGSEHPDVVVRLLGTSHVGFYVAPRHRHRSFESLLSELPLLLCNGESSSRRFIEHLLHDLGLGAAGIISSDFPSLLHRLCQEGLGIGVFTEGFPRWVDRELTALKPPRSALRVQNHLYALWTRDAENSLAIKRLRALLDGMSDQ